MATYTIFGTGTPAGTWSVDGGGGSGIEGSCSTAFYQTGLAGFKVVGIRVYIPPASTIAAAGCTADLWLGTGNSPTSIVASATFSNILAGQWNTALFATPITFLASRFYWAQVYFPSGKFGFQSGVFSSGGPIASVDLANIFAAGFAQITTEQGAFVAGASGSPPGMGGGGHDWYGVDILVDDGTGVFPGASDPFGITDDVSILRTGLPTTVAASATVTDPLAASTSDTAVLPVGAATAEHTISRGLFDYRVAWGGVTGVTVPHGPSFQSLSARSLALEFTVLRNVRFAGCRIYKAPNLVGSIDVTLWSQTGPGGSWVDEGMETESWTTDDGGWREVAFATPVDLFVGTVYKLAYLSANGVHAYSNSVFTYFSDVVYPLRVAAWSDPNFNATGIGSGGSAYHIGTAHTVPEIHNDLNYYIEPIVEWEQTDPVFVPDPAQSFYDQWVNGAPRKPFHFSVFFADPSYLVEYAAMGITTLVAGSATPEYIAAVKTADMDHYVYAGQFPVDDTGALGMAIAAVSEDPAYAACVVGYHIDDEPDLTPPYRPPNVTLGWIQDLRYKDSTRPTVLGLSKVVGINQTFYHMPQGATLDEGNALWKQWAAQPDILMGDFYTLSTPEDPQHRWGVYTYAKYTERLRMLCEGKAPIWVAVETTAQRPDQPDPDDVVKACWACLIAGAQGIVFFDHRFGDQFVTQDFAHMLHNPPMKAAVSAFIVQGNSLADALHSPEANLVTAHTSSNVTEGPYGGTFGVPMHFTTRDDGTNQYLFAMGIRPGATIATFTVPAWAGETVDVLGESRTVIVDGSGVLTDTFAADYTIHLYRL